MEPTTKMSRLDPRVSAAQREALLNFMTEHPQIALGAADLSPTITQTDKVKLWAELVAELNAIGPAVKDRRRWQHYWTDRVRAAKKKADEFRRNSGGTGGGAVPGEAGRIIAIVGPDAVEGCGAPAVPGPQLGSQSPLCLAQSQPPSRPRPRPRCPRAERHSVDAVTEALIRGQQRLVELAVARLAALEQQTSAIRQLTLVLLLLVLMTSATRQPCLPLPCRPPTPPPLD
ncbi:hypothetical protein HPB47_014313 [Ixodes persulcatus]|uniref:Uncharacterized protein n=1 Tax=Ixodes persulcatus TaxID=34615 RepID=A0AC60QXF9_IXOPE|nr:hypothetical protein HPB47_014313 [Ixodes persulcatus]